MCCIAIVSKKFGKIFVPQKTGSDQGLQNEFKICNENDQVYLFIL
jgi:hypothetical protein